MARHEMKQINTTVGQVVGIEGIEYHVTSVRNGSVYGHDSKHCDDAGCAGDETYIADCAEETEQPIWSEYGYLVTPTGQIIRPATREDSDRFDDECLRVGAFEASIDVVINGAEYKGCLVVDENEVA